MRTSLAITLGLAGILAGCGPTIGDPCTTAADCSGVLCLNVASPGGYCTAPCNVTEATSCPTGSVCVRDALAKNSPACFRLCNRPSECRSGYTCRSINSSPNICVGSTF
jgi:hypothetical protein